MKSLSGSSALIRNSMGAPRGSISSWEIVSPPAAIRSCHHQVDPREFLRDGMFDLNAGVDLEVVVAVLVENSTVPALT